MYINIKYKHILIWSGILVVACIFITFLVVRTNEITYGKKMVLEDNKLKITSYYTEYDLTVISNKNINTYFVKEWYKESVGSRIEYLDYMGNIISVITTPNDCYISNTGNKAYILTKNVYGTNNILSLATYISYFNNETTCRCTKNVYSKDNEINLVIELCRSDECIHGDILKNFGVGTLELSIIDNKLATYTVYLTNKKEYACIVYNKFDFNIEINNDVFNINK